MPDAERVRTVVITGAGSGIGRAAAVAFDRYGKGIDPTARLNLADCAAYALAATMNAPLLFKGDDFAATDVRACL